MRVLASALMNAADSFLHAGYLSAMAPEVPDAAPLPILEPDVVVDLGRALELAPVADAGRLMPGAASTVSSAGAPAIVAWLHALGAGLVDWLATAWIPGLMIGVGLVFLLALREALSGRLRGARRAVFERPARGSPGSVVPIGAALCGGLVAVFAGLASSSQAGVAEPSPSTVDGTCEFRPYLHPELATSAIQYGLLRGELMANPERASLEQLVEGLSLPFLGAGDGERQALRCADRDGWGRPFRIERRSPDYWVISAGSDGVFGNSDDLTVTADADSWMYGHAGLVRTVYLRGVDGQLQLLYRPLDREDRRRDYLVRARQAAEAAGIDGFALVKDAEIPSSAKKIWAEQGGDGKLLLLAYYP